MYMHNGLDALDTLTETVADSVNGFRQGAEHAASNELRQMFEGLAEERSLLRDELLAELRRRGKASESKGSTLGQLHQAWIGLKSSISGRDDKVAIDGVRHGEAFLKEKFETVMSREEMDEDIRAIAERAYHRACDGHDLVRDLKRRMEVTECEPFRPDPRPMVG